MKKNGNIASLGDLKQDSKNARKHTPRNVGMIESALREVGAARSGVIDENGTILAGNATYEALAAAGIDKVKVVDANGEEWVVVRRRGLTKRQKTRLALYDNRAAELADWDLDVLGDIDADDLDGLFSVDELGDLLGDERGGGDEAPEAQIDKADELQQKWQVKPGDVWEIGRHRLMILSCGRRG